MPNGKNKVLYVECMGIEVELSPSPTPENPNAMEAKIFAASAPRMPNNPTLDLAVNVILGFVASCAACGVDVESKEFNQAVKQIATHYVRSLGNPNFGVN